LREKSAFDYEGTEVGRDEADRRIHRAERFLEAVGRSSGREGAMRPEAVD